MTQTTAAVAAAVAATAVGGTLLLTALWPTRADPLTGDAIRALVRHEIADMRAMPDEIEHRAPVALVRSGDAPDLIPLWRVVRVSTVDPITEVSARVAIRLQGESAETVYETPWSAIVIRIARHHEATNPDVPLQHAWMLVSDRRGCYAHYHLLRIADLHYATANPLGPGTDLEIRYVLPGPPEIVDDEQIPACQDPDQLQRQQVIGWPNVIGEVQ